MVCVLRRAVLPLVAQQITLIKLFVQTDPSVLPVGLVLSAVSRTTTLLFFAVLIVMFTMRHVAQRTASGFYPRCAAVAGNFSASACCCYRCKNFRRCFT